MIAQFYYIMNKLAISLVLRKNQVNCNLTTQSIAVEEYLLHFCIDIEKSLPKNHIVKYQ